MNTRFDHAYVLDVLSDDHPGIVASVGMTIQELSGNIDSITQTVLEGYFTLTMIVSFPEAIEANELARRVGKARTGKGVYQVMARPFVPPAADDKPELAGRFVVTAFGPDVPGILLTFSQYMAGKDINIVDLYGERSGEQFVMISQVDIPARWDIALLQAELEEMGRSAGFDVRLQHENIFVATNQLRLSSEPAGRSILPSKTARPKRT